MPGFPHRKLSPPAQVRRLQSLPSVFNRLQVFKKVYLKKFQVTNRKINRLRFSLPTHSRYTSKATDLCSVSSMACQRQSCAIIGRSEERRVGKECRSRW